MGGQIIYNQQSIMRKRKKEQKNKRMNIVHSCFKKNYFHNEGKKNERKEGRRKEKRKIYIELKKKGREIKKIN